MRVYPVTYNFPKIVIQAIKENTCILYKEIAILGILLMFVGLSLIWIITKITQKITSKGNDL